MKSFRKFSFGLIHAVCAFAALAAVASAEEAAWQTDFPAAQAKAKAERKLLLVDFTGSDWCIWCKKLKAEVFDNEPFAAETAKHFVLVELDFPHEKKLPAQLKEQNAKLAKQYKITGFPSVLILTPDGELVAHTGYRPGGAENYTKELADLLRTYESLTGLREQLAKAEGLDRAKLLDQLVEAYDKLGNKIGDIPAWQKEIIALDTDNKAGLKVKYQYRELLAEASALNRNRKYSEAQAAVEKIVQLPGLTGEQKQDAYLAVVDYMGLHEGPSSTVAKLQKALEAAPESRKAAMIKPMIARLQATAEAEAAAVKLKAEVDKASAADRLKLLDQLLDAYAKLGNRLAGKDQSADVNKWSREVMELDADNHAGLKRKYEFRIDMDDVQKAMRGGDFAAAEKAVDKALALADLSPEELQKAALWKSNFCNIRKDYQAGLDCLRKALDAAPDSPNAAILKLLIQRSEKLLKAQGAGKAGDKTEKPHDAI